MSRNITGEVQIALPMDEIAAFCRRWNITEFALFGSVLTEEFGPESDVDVLVTFAPDAPQSPDRETMREELEAIFGRPVDLLYRRVVEYNPNYIIRDAILDSAKVVYAA
ncbi:MAG TPA: nucleotidyltransferase domain-containing protein [Caldilineaceae bacterium]|nr:nucleotidyltransferase domain-containing protein [Caldilineaceae bacterium]